MALTATYDTLLSRIRLAADTLGTATYAVFDRTLNGVTYTTIRGGSHVTVTSSAAHIDDYEFPVGETITYRVRSYNASNVLQATFTVATTQDLGNPWLKSVTRPFLNREVTLSTAGDISHQNRVGIFPILGRTDPIAITDVSSQMSFDLTLTTFSAGEADAVRYLVTSGDTIYLQMPTDCEFKAPSGYYVVGTVTEARRNNKSERKWFTLPLIRIIAPGPDVVPTTYTWSSTLSEYATWTDVIADNATWADLLERIGSASEVIVP